MSHDRRLAKRVRAAFGTTARCAEVPMFGGLAFVHRGELACVVREEDVMLRLGESGCNRALADRDVRPVDFTDPPRRDMVVAGGDAIRTRPQLERWIREVLAHLHRLPRPRA